MVLEVRTGDIIDRLGHDGSQILWPLQPEPLCRRGFHIEEMQYVALRLGKVLTGFLPKLAYQPAPECTPFWIHFDYDYNHLLTFLDGVMVGSYYESKQAHAVAWNAKEGMIYDPAGRRVSRERFDVEAFYACFTPGV
jgi:hypothetical protein